MTANEAFNEGFKVALELFMYCYRDYVDKKEVISHIHFRRNENGEIEAYILSKDALNLKTIGDAIYDKK